MLSAGGETAVSMTRSPSSNRVRSITGASAVSCSAPGVDRSKSRSTSSDSADTNSPQTLCRGNSPASSSTTRAPKRAAVIAADAPAGPPPITAISKLGSLMAVAYCRSYFHSNTPIRNKKCLESSTRFAGTPAIRDFISAMVYARRTEAGASCHVMRLAKRGRPA